MGKKNKTTLFFYSLVIFLLPFLLPNSYHLMVLNVAALNIIMVIGLTLLMGFAGQISLGHAAFFGLGAYLSAVFTASLSIPLWPALVLAMLLTGLVAYAIGIPTLKLEGHYLVMATLGFNVIVYILMVQLDSVTGGPSGFAGIPRLAIGSFVFDSDRKIYYLLWGFSIVSLLLALNLVHSRAGRAMAALSHNEIAAKCAGIDTETAKVKIFVIPTDEERVNIEDVIGILEGKYDEHTRFAYRFQSPDYVNSQREQDFVKECEKKPGLKDIQVKPKKS